MADKRSCDGAGNCAAKKKKRRILSLEMKSMIIKLSADGHSNSEIGRRFDLPRTTVVSVVKDKNRILDEVGNLAPIHSTVVRKREGVAEMEKLLNVWIADQTSRQMHPSKAAIRKKALTLFEDVKRRLWDGSTDVTFNASKNWFARFKGRSGLLCVKEQAEAIDYVKDFARIVEEGGYCSRRVFSVNEFDLLWKMLPSKSYISKATTSVPGYNAADDRLTLLMGSNAAGDFKLKPMLVCHSKNPIALEGHAKRRLPVMLRSNLKAAVTTALFEDWFSCHFANMAEAYCLANDLPFKVLLVVDSGPCHPQKLDTVHPNINVVFLPTTTTAVLQPTNLEVFKAFKSCYLQRLYSKAAVETGKRGGATPLEFWMGFSILDAVTMIADSWNDVKAGTLNCAWRNLYPQFVKDSECIENPVEVVVANVFDMAKQMDLEVVPEELTKLLESHSRRLVCMKDLNSDEQGTVESESEEEESRDAPTTHVKELTCRRLSEAFKLLERAMTIFEADDPDFDRSTRINEGIFDQYACYRETYLKMKNAQLKFPMVTFPKEPSANSQTSEPSKSPVRSLAESDDADESSLASTSFLDVTF